MIPESLDEREDIVPSATIEPNNVVLQHIDDLLHLECGQHVLYEDSALDATGGNVEPLLREGEDIRPQLCLLGILQLGQVEVGTGAIVKESLCVVEGVESKVEQGGRDWLLVDLDVLLW